MLKNLENLTEASAKSSALQAIWTFPSIIFAALVIAWGAEAAQFLVSQAFALTLLALIQTLPEFTVEGFIAWNAGKFPTSANIGLMTANFTGAVRLLMGLGWPLIYVTASAFYIGRNKKLKLPKIKLDDEHAIEILGLFVASLYSFVIVIKGFLSLFDTLVLFAVYGVYIAILLKLPAQDEEAISDLEMIPQYILTRKPWKRNFLIWSCFIVGGVGILLVAGPFLESAIGLSFVMGVPAFMLIQWLAPFLSEFPEKVSAFYWAKSITKTPMALMNMTSSAIAELTLLIAIIPIVFCIALGKVSGIPFDWAHRAEILLTATQAILGAVILSKMVFKWFEAVGLFILWASQIFFQYAASQISLPAVNIGAFGAWLWDKFHIQVLVNYTLAYWIWIVVELILIIAIYKKIPLIQGIKKTLASRK